VAHAQQSGAEKLVKAVVGGKLHIKKKPYKHCINTKVKQRT
jgi:hypothetical protein